MLLLMLCVGCSTPKRDNGARLISRPDFPAARIAAPGWTLDALNTIAELEAELDTR
jgi:hypothetical protein